MVKLHRAEGSWMRKDVTEAADQCFSDWAIQVLNRDTEYNN